MRRIVLLWASLASAVLLFGAVPTVAPTAAQGNLAQPNFVFVIADDMRKDDLRYMPKTRALLGDKGVRFGRAFVSSALCCPSRATIMRGQYAHNTGVWSNSPGPDGGWQGYVNHGHEQDNIATRLHDEAGYRTGLFGKYLNKYHGTTVPSGWDDWFVLLQPERGARGAAYFDYDVNDNGVLRHFGTRARDYSTDVYSRQTQEFIDASVNRGKPFFAYVAPSAPHVPAIPAPRHEGAFDGEQAPRSASFNESDVSDKPPWIGSLPPLTPTQRSEIDAHHERRVESLQAVDELVEALVGKLHSVGALENTYVVFTSDNGYQLGEHRIPEGKAQPYEESIRVPLLVRGPDVQEAGSSTNKLVLNTDYFPTFTDLAGMPTPDYVDGRSLRPLLEGSATNWRTAILLERRDDEDPDTSLYGSLTGIRTKGGMKYIEHEGGIRELYALKVDPSELHNSHEANPPRAGLVARLRALKSCSGTTCRQAEDGS